MAWVCPRCSRRIYAPRQGSIRYGMVYRYLRRQGELEVELENLASVPSSAVVTHVSCKEEPGASERLRDALRMPANSIHPMLD